MCTRNTIKSTIGDAADCNTDTPCDGETEVPDVDHSARGKYRNTDLRPWQTPIRSLTQQATSWWCSVPLSDTH